MSHDARAGIVKGCQIAIGLLLLVAALAKLGNVQAFAVQVHNFRVVPVAVENVIALALPWVELLAGLALVLGLRPRAGALVASGLLGVFTLAVLAALARGLDIECGCFGTADATRVGGLKVAQNLAMLGLAVGGCWLPGPRR